MKLKFSYRIHPRDKQDVAYRLVLSSLAVAYNQSVLFQGPFPVHLTMEDWQDGARVNVTYTTNVKEVGFEGFEVSLKNVHISIGNKVKLQQLKLL